MKTKVQFPNYSSSISSVTHLKLDRKRIRRLRFCLPLNLRVSLVAWICLLVVITYTLTYVELDSVRNALRNVKLRSSSVHEHEDTTNSGLHDLKQELESSNTLDLPSTNDLLATVRPLEEPPTDLDMNVDVKKGTEQKMEELPPDLIAQLKEPSYPRVMFVDTPEEERRKLIKPKKPKPLDIHFTEMKETKNGTQYNVAQNGAAKWNVNNVALHWNDPPTANGFSSGIPHFGSRYNQPMKLEPIINGTVTAKVGLQPTTPKPDKTSSQPTTITTTTEKLLVFPVDFGYSQHASNNISAERKVPDSRHEKCKKKKYSSKQQATIIISVYNEAWSVLLRTIHSIMERTPAHLLSEVVIVDDASDEKLSYMGEQLPEYVTKHWDNVFVARNGEREGLIWSRNDAVQTRSFGSVVVFLESHVEVNNGWLEPLMEEIEKDWRTVAVPVLDRIDPQTFVYQVGPAIPQKADGFQWNLHPIKIAKPKPNGGDEVAPFTSPIMDQGMFAVSKKFFKLMDGFDSKLELFGAENLEMSFQAWMCGGRVEIVPCSRIGHVDKGRLPSLRTDIVEKKIQRNKLRVAKTWMDEHSIFYENSMSSLKKLNYGDVTGRIQLKNGINCQSFDWYLKNVYPQLYNPKGKIIADTEIRSLGMDGTLCLDALSIASGVAKMFPCHGSGGNQRFWYTTKGELRRYDQCLDYWGTHIQFFPCHGAQGNQLWLYLNDSNKIKHVNSGRCMTVTSNDTVEMELCEEGQYNQLWTMNNFNSTAYEEAGFAN